MEDPLLMSLLHVILGGDTAKASEILTRSPVLARQSIAVGATREGPKDYYFPAIEHYLYAGDTALHAAAAGYRVSIARELMQHHANIAARNRRGAEPLHYAADGSPGSRTWNPQAQAEMIAFLIGAGANPDALDKSGVAPLHRAVRVRCTGAVNALLAGGAGVNLKNKNGSTPLQLAMLTTGRGGSGSAEAKACQQEILQMLIAAGAKLK